MELPHITREDWREFARHVGTGLMHIVMLDPLASHGSHFVNPHDRIPFEGAPSIPRIEEEVTMYDDMGNYYEGDLSSLLRAEE